MAANDVALAKAFRARCAYIIRLQFGNQRCAQEARKDSRHIDAERQRGQRDVSQHLKWRFPERNIARRGRQPSEFDREEKDEQNSEPEGGNAERQGAPAAEDPVKPGIREQRTGHCDRNSQQEGDQCRGDSKLERRRQSLGDQIQHRLAAVNGNAKIASSAPPSHAPYCTRTGRSRPSCLVAAAICSWVAFSPTMTPTGPPGTA